MWGKEKETEHIFKSPDLTFKSLYIPKKKRKRELTQEAAGLLGLEKRTQNLCRKHAKTNRIWDLFKMVSFLHIYTKGHFETLQY